jgi:alkylated DNA repair dioxygenase AlkB
MSNAPVPDLEIDRSASTVRTDLDDTAWFSLTTGFVRDPDRWFTDLHDTLPWRQPEVLRYDHYIPEKRLATGLSAESNSLVHQTDLHLRSRYRVPFEGVAALLYRTGEDFQGLHSDRSMKWLDDTLIAIVVLGVRRPFAFRKRVGTAAFVDKTPPGQLEGDVIAMPGEGDLLIMGGASQRTWLHGVPAADTDEARISLTWRWTSRRGRPDMNPGYFDGRSFSDAPTGRQPGYRSRRPG